MFVSFDFEVNGEITTEEAIAACREYIRSYTTTPEMNVDINRSADKIPAVVTMTLVRASHTPAALPGDE